MTFTEAYESARGQKTEFFQLEKGFTTLRFLSKPIAITRAFLDMQNTDGTASRKSLWVYKGCGYEDEGKVKFVSYIIDPKDERDEDGKIKVKKIEVGWTVLENLSKKEKMREEQGISPETFPMLTDIIINKEGDKMQTKYSCDFSLKNKTTATPEEISEALAGLESLEDWRHKSTEAEKKNHIENGLPNIIRKAVVSTPKVETTNGINIDDIPF